MESLKHLQQWDNILSGATSVLNVLLAAAQFLFLTVWGWVILLAALMLIILVNARGKDGEITPASFIGGAAKTVFSFYSNITTILAGLVILLLVLSVFNILKDVSKSLTLFREVKMLEAALKNLKTERKLMELSVKPSGNSDKPKWDVKVRYFAYSPVKDTDLFSGESAYTIDGRKLYIDFGLINFDYSLIEKGSAKNLAFPNRIFSETIAAADAQKLFALSSGVPLTFKLDEQDLYDMDQADYQQEIQSIFEAVTNSTKARRMGIRATYGEAIGFYPVPERVYSFYSLGSGGITVR